MIAHVSIPVSDFKKSKEFYIKALEPLGYKVKMEFDGAAGFMADGETSFWIVEKPSNFKAHVGFRAKNKEDVHAFHEAALKAGGKDNGQPGPRPDYSPDYYASFVFDPDGNNMEAVYYTV